MGRISSEDDYERVAASLEDAIPSGTPTALRQSLGRKTLSSTIRSRVRRDTPSISAVWPGAQQELVLDRRHLSSGIDASSAKRRRYADGVKKKPLTEGEQLAWEKEMREAGITVAHGAQLGVRVTLSQRARPKVETSHRTTRTVELGRSA